MAQLIVCRVRENGDYETIVAIQENMDGAMELALQVKGRMEETREDDDFAILHRDELTSVISDDGKCESLFKGG